MKIENINEASIGEIVAHDLRAASVFNEAGIDFCCGGKKSLDQACREKNVNPDELKRKLQNIESFPDTSTHNFNEWDLSFLSDYIVNAHHKYVRRSLPELLLYTQKIAKVHGGNHPELAEVAELISQVNRELIQHMEKEETILFPAIKEVQNSDSQDSKAIITDEIEHLSGEHEFAGGAMDKINEITGGYNVPEDGCNSYRLAFKLLKEFEDDLHIHVHLENNILFPKALETAKQ
jgi:regulator of cell morphogenesis and NO signaling